MKARGLFNSLVMAQREPGLFFESWLMKLVAFIYESGATCSHSDATRPSLAGAAARGSERGDCLPNSARPLAAHPSFCTPVHTAGSRSAHDPCLITRLAAPHNPRLHA